MPGKRIAVIDIIKGLLILLIAVFHLVYRPMGSVFDLIMQDSTYLGIPVFFLLSGYFYKFEGRVFPPMGKRLKKFALPIVGSSLAVLILLAPYYMIFHGYSFHQWLSDVITTYMRPEFTAWLLPSFSSTGPLFENVSPVWYIWALVFSTIVLYIIMHFTKDDPVKITISILILLVIGTFTYVLLPAMSWSLTNVPVYTALMMTGFLISKYKVIDKFCSFNLPVSVIIATAILVGHYFLYKYLGWAQMYRSVYDHDHSYYATIVFAVQTLIGGYALLTYARLIEKVKPLSFVIEWCGRHTPEFIVFHYVIGGLAADLLHTYNKCGENWYVDPVTPKIFYKSVITVIIAIAGSVGIGILNDKLWEHVKRKRVTGDGSH
ncbi:MAG: acyltransferase family protein [Clostridiales bacterium]|nr:acyltransferase family protein [Clostridiales bacterium]